MARQDDETRLRALARLHKERRAAERRWSQHPWPFLSEAAVTIDQVAGTQAGGGRPWPAEPVEPRPDCVCGGCGNYVHHVVNMWYLVGLQEHDRSFLIAKSRRLFITWAMLGVHWWLARYRPGTLVAVVARKLGENESQGSAELVRRIKWMERHLPPHAVRPVVEEGFGRIRWPGINSEIVAIGQGADQMRQYTVTAAFCDECAFWEEAEGTYAAAIPTLQGGGRLTMVSTANPGFYECLVHDRLTSDGARA